MRFKPFAKLFKLWSLDYSINTSDEVQHYIFTPNNQILHGTVLRIEMSFYKRLTPLFVLLSSTLHYTILLFVMTINRSAVQYDGIPKNIVSYNHYSTVLTESERFMDKWKLEEEDAAEKQRKRDAEAKPPLRHRHMPQTTQAISRDRGLLPDRPNRVLRSLRGKNYRSRAVLHLFGSGSVFNCRGTQQRERDLYCAAYLQLVNSECVKLDKPLFSARAKYRSTVFKAL